MLLTTIHNTDIYITTLSDTKSRSNRRHIESEATAALVAEAFGPEACLLHHRNGAPYVKDSDKSVSISHSRFHAVLAVNHADKVGIDIENMRVRSLMRVAERFLTPAERLVASTPTALLEAWTVKEAIYKSLDADKQPAGLIDVALPIGWQPTVAEGAAAIITLHVAEPIPFTVSLNL